MHAYYLQVKDYENGGNIVLALLYSRHCLNLINKYKETCELEEKIKKLNLQIDSSRENLKTKETEREEGYNKLTFDVWRLRETFYLLPQMLSGCYANYMCELFKEIIKLKESIVEDKAELNLSRNLLTQRKKRAWRHRIFCGY